MPVLLFVLLQLLRPTDGGPIYAETNLSRSFVEPWNSLSSLTFLAPVFYWAFRLRGRYHQYRFLTACMPLLAIGGLGSTLFHGLRASQWLLLMDWLPIALLTLSIGIYFWWRILPHWLWVVLVVGSSLALRVVLFNWGRRWGMMSVINLSYFVTGVTMFLPALILLLRTRFRGLPHILLATVLFMLALWFRQIDAVSAGLPMGTHWLWHVCCGVGAWFLANYLYLIANQQVEGKRKSVTIPNVT